MNNCSLAVICASSALMLGASLIMPGDTNKALVEQNANMAAQLAKAAEEPYKAQIAMLEAEKKRLMDEAKSCK